MKNMVSIQTTKSLKQVSDIKVDDSDIKFQISVDLSSLKKQNKGEVW
jgi:hypothetical protein